MSLNLLNTTRLIKGGLYARLRPAPLGRGAGRHRRPLICACPISFEGLGQKKRLYAVVVGQWA